MLLSVYNCVSDFTTYALLDPVIGAGLVAGIGSVLGGLFGHSGQSSANRTNIQLAREQRQFDLDMWNRQNEYNLPTNQLRRYQEAGINPYMALSNIQSGNAQTTAGGQNPAKVDNTMLPMAQGIQNASQLVAQNMYDAQLKASQVNQINAATQNQRTENLFQLTTLGARIRSLRANSKIDWLNKRLLENTFQNQLNIIRNQDSITEATAKNEGVSYYRNLFEYNLQTMYGIRFKRKELEHLEKSIDALDNQIDTSKRLTDAEINKMANDFTVALGHLQIERYLAPSQRMLNQANAFNARMSGNLSKFYKENGEFEQGIRKAARGYIINRYALDNNLVGSQIGLNKTNKVLSYGNFGLQLFDHWNNNIGPRAGMNFIQQFVH